MDENQMHAHAAAWIDAWNRGDLDAVLAAFHDDARFISPLAARLTGNPLVAGKPALRAYWTEALRRRGGPPNFRLDHVLCDPTKGEMLVVYERLEGGKRTRACELMLFDESGLQVHGEAMHGAELEESARR
jgi:ketosteroid isomerase-like protein